MKRIFIYGFTALLLLSSCSDWLNVMPKEQTSAKDLFTTYDGYCDALNGCYIKLKDRSLYGEKLTMGDIEYLGQLWRTPREVTAVAHEIKNFNYAGDYTKSMINTVYANLYNIIAQANMIINSMPEYGSAIGVASKRAVIEGEALAIRAFCHFDILRLFGQLPQNGTLTVSLPYAETVSPFAYAPYYNYNDFVKKIEDDLLRAISLLQDNDPLFSLTYGQLTGTDEPDQFMRFRQSRFSYWAVKALQARFYLYTGAKDKAYAAAKSVVEATGADGNPLLTLSGLDDMVNNYHACPSEALMQLNVYNIMDYAVSVLGTGMGMVVSSNNLVLAYDMYEALFQGYELSNRARGVWDPTYTDFDGDRYAIFLKYYYNTAQSASTVVELTKRQVVPILRLSEMYLILLETTTDLAEANSRWYEYLISHGINPSLITPFTSLTEVMTEVVKLYRIELAGEGQLFYMYKRMGSTYMLGRTEAITERNYIAPLPETEFNPNL